MSIHNGSQPQHAPGSLPAHTQEATPSIGEPQPDKILLATDNHIGYAEKDPIRGQDAINTFREILQLAKEMEVDFILLAGDLFHENRPSRACLHQTIALLREYTLGDRPIGVELLSDPMDGKASGFSFPAVNYEDPNLNIAIPVFSIHGNHDDPQGTGPEGALCALDILSVSGVLNYFGKVDLYSDEQVQEDAKGIQIKPILLRKGTSHLALYGVGNVKDARMHYELRSNRVKMFMPEEGEEEWFNLLLVHQNRVKHGPQESVPEGMFDNSFKLVVWGHEHDCRIWPEKVPDRDYYITQPGSSVATSLAPGEALPKHVGLLSIQGGVFQIAEIPLKTVRPFEMDEVVLAEVIEEEDTEMDLEDKDSITTYLKKRVAELIDRAQAKWDENHPDDDEEMMLPLIRLKVETTGVKEMTNPVRFGQAFIGKVANPKDILQYYRKRKPAEKKAKVNADAPEMKDEDEDDEDETAMTTRDRLNKLRMADLVQQHLKAQSLEVLVEGGLEDAVMRFVEKDDRDAIKDFVANALKSVGNQMRGQDIDEEDVEQRIADAKKTSVTEWAEVEGRSARDRAAHSKKGKTKAAKDTNSMVDSMEEEDDDMGVDEAPLRHAGPKTKAKAPARGKAKEKLFLDDEAEEDDEDEIDDSEEEVVQKPKKRAAPVKKAAAPKKALAKKPAPKRATQSQLAFGPSTARSGKKSAPIELDSDE